MAIVRYAGNRMTGVSGDTKPTEGSLITGTTFHETNTDDLYIWDGDSWNIVSGNTVAETLSSKTLTSPVLNGTLSGTAFLDEDNFASDSAIATASQQSIKAYVASQVPGSQNVFNTIAVSGQDNVVADAATDTLTLAAGSGMTITTTAGSDTVTFAASGGATLTVTDNESTNENNLLAFIADAGTSTGAHALEMDGDLHYNPSTGTVTATVFAGALTGNASGTAATVTGAAQTAITSVGTLTALQVDNLNVNGNTISATSGALNITPAGGSAIVLDGTISVDAGVVTGATSITSTAFVGALTGNASGTAATVTGAAQTAITSVGTLTGLDLTSGDKTIFATVGNNTLTIGASNTTVNIAGDLTIAGDATTVNTATLSVEDPLIILANGNNAADAVDIGFYGLYDTSGSQDLYAGLFRDANDSGKWKLFKDNQAAPGTTVDTGGTGYAVGTLVANVEGNITGSAGSATGNAATATALATARTIGGTSFDGTANIVPGTSTALATGRTISASGDITWTSASFDGSANVTSVAAITADSIINADIKSDAAIADSKLATISTADKVAGGAIQIDSGTDGTGITIADADKLLIDDGGATKYINASQIKTYAAGSGASESFAIAMAVAL